MPKLAAALVLALALFPVGCSIPLAPDASRSEDRSDAEPLPLSRLRLEPYSFTYYSGMEDSVRIVVREVSTWRSVWQTIWRNHSPPRPLPEMDFRRDMLIVAALGTRNSGGYGIYVDSAYQRADHIEVVVRKVSPGRGCIVSGALTQPVDIATLPLSAQRVRFRERNVVHNCE